MGRAAGRGWGWLPLYLAFAGTGVGVALPGVLLPVLLPEWRLQDEQGGRLLFMTFLGASAGALLVRGSLRWTLVLGSFASVVAAVGLAKSAGPGSWAWFALFGLGLGMLMTSISLARQQQTGGSGTEMVRLNLVWAVGASVSPVLTTLAGRYAGERTMLYGLALLFAALAAWGAGRSDLSGLAGRERHEGGRKLLQRVPLGFLVMTMLITGVEAAAGGWLATFAKRGGEGMAGVVAAPTCLWVGLLLSRMFWSVDWRERGAGSVTQSRVVRGSLGLMAVAAAALLLGREGWVLLAAAGCLGFGIGPVYPLLLAWVLRFHRGGEIFFLAGVGSALVPWLTGVVSTARGSLRVGLAIPLAAVLVMLGLALAMPLRRLSGEPT